MINSGVNIVWFKRDLRLADHAPLRAAIDGGRPILLVAFVEPILFSLPQYEERHARFIQDSVIDMNAQLSQELVHLLHMEPVDFFNWAHKTLGVHSVFSYQETGIKHTFDRDVYMQQWFAERNISWVEYVANGVQRGLRNRRDWVKKWYTDAASPLISIDLEALKTRAISIVAENELAFFRHEFEPHPYLQKGGERRAHKVLHSFLNDRISNYARSISKPLESRKGCSRISPHLAWGNLSIRQVYRAMNIADSTQNKRNFRAFADRLRWQAHFIQKFESEWEYEFHTINRGYEQFDARKPMNEALFTAWKEGKTGVPLVDACMRCLNATGYLNFRMRAMVVSFYSHYLWLPWKPGADYLASLFTDFEPGIHYAQFQMQTGYTGINTIRIYNPIKQSTDHDPEGKFIKMWLPELVTIPAPYIHEPWNIPPLEKQLMGYSTGSYPETPVVDLKAARKHASDTLYAMRKDPTVRQESARILGRHVNPGPRNS